MHSPPARNHPQDLKRICEQPPDSVVSGEEIGLLHDRENTLRHVIPGAVYNG